MYHTNFFYICSTPSCVTHIFCLKNIIKKKFKIIATKLYAKNVSNVKKSLKIPISQKIKILMKRHASYVPEVKIKKKFEQ